MVEYDDIAQWRAQIFQSLMLMVLVIVLLASLLDAALAMHHNLTRIELVVLLALGSLVALLRLEHISYIVRVVSFIAIMYGVAIGCTVWFGSLGVCFLISLPVLSVILLGMSWALVSLALSSASMLALGLTGYSVLPVVHYEMELAVLLFTLNITCVSAIVICTISQMLRGLATSLSRARDVATSLDERQAALHALNGKLSLSSAALAGLNEMVLVAEIMPTPAVTLPIIFVNAAFERWSGYRKDEIFGHSVHMLQRPGTDHAFVARINAAIARCEPFSTEFEAYNRADLPCWLELEIAPFAQDEGAFTHWVVVARDITEKKRSAAAVHQLAYFDVLTGLPNRRMLMDRLETLIVNVQTGRVLGAVLYIDLDNFKKVNDARGHAIGDALLMNVAERISDIVGIGNSVSRFGGDEFIVLLENLDSDISVASARALTTAQDICAILQLPYHIGGQTYHSSSSIGVALSTCPDQTAQGLLREADTAMYIAKSGGCNRVALFEPTMLAAAEAALTLELELANALHNDELVLHFQLQFDYQGAPVGAEALVRWQRPGGSLVAPDVFIGVAETTGLIVPLGDWVLRQACLAWHQLELSGQPLPLSVNISPGQLLQPDFVAGVRSALDDTGMPAHQLIFEVTEGMRVDDLDQIIARMDELAALEIRFSIDDFGTGYSNLRYLRKMPLHELKIDRSFVHDVPDDINGTAIVRTMLAMASHLGLRVVVEGIETEEQAQFFRKHGAPTMQGYLFCRPMPLVSLIHKLALAFPHRHKHFH